MHQFGLKSVYRQTDRHTHTHTHTHTYTHTNIKHTHTHIIDREKKSKQIKNIYSPSTMSWMCKKEPADVQNTNNVEKSISQYNIDL